jgi:FtsH-binding integral membrane protein
MYSNSTTLTQDQVITVRSFMGRTYNWMAAGLVMTAAMAYLTLHSDAIKGFVFGGGLLPLMLAELAMVFILSLMLPRLSAGVAGALFIGYALLNGMTLSSVFLVYTSAAITSAFAVSAVTFILMSILGYTIKLDLSRFRSIAFMALIGLLVAMVVNMFLHSGPLGFVISALGVLLFAGLTAFDTQMLRRMALHGTAAGLAPRQRGGAATASVTGQFAASDKLAIIGALKLYLDFIMMFLFLLQLFGGGRR